MASSPKSCRMDAKPWQTEADLKPQWWPDPAEATMGVKHPKSQWCNSTYLGIAAVPALCLTLYVPHLVQERRPSSAEARVGLVCLLAVAFPAAVRARSLSQQVPN